MSTGQMTINLPGKSPWLADVRARWGIRSASFSVCSSLEKAAAVRKTNVVVVVGRRFHGGVKASSTWCFAALTGAAAALLCAWLRGPFLFFPSLGSCRLDNSRSICNFFSPSLCEFRTKNLSCLSLFSRNTPLASRVGSGGWSPVVRAGRALWQSPAGLCRLRQQRSD